MADPPRTYRKKRRAELEARTRRRITESAVALHGTVGPSRTTMSAIAAHAGVRRSTLYRHFPDESAVFAACSAHWMAANPLPDLARWAAIADPGRRLGTALRDLYGYYGRAEPMLANLFRDAPLIGIVEQHLGALREYMSAARRVLSADADVHGAARRRRRAAIGHALAFTTWRSLVREQGLSEAQAVGLMVGLVAAAAARSARR
jgi:AcrR family transcriptional regulator